jgi:hypothetical protein
LAMLGRMCRTRMRAREAPSTDAAVTYFLLARLQRLAARESK